MATTSFRADGAAFFYSGQWSLVQAPASGGQQAYECQGANSTIEFSFTGTDCSMLATFTNVASPVLKVSIDGGALATLANPGSINAYSSVALAAGLADALHTALVTQAGGNTGTWAVQLAAGFSVTGAAPAVSYTAAVPSGPTYRPLAEMLGRSRWEGCWQYLGGGYGGATGYNSPATLRGYTGSPNNTQGASARWKGKASRIRMWVNQTGGLYVPLIDGVAQAQATLPSTSTYGWNDLLTGLDPAAGHEYGVIQASGDLDVMAVQMVGGSLDAAAAYPRRGAVAWWGDSITAGNAGAPAQTYSNCFAWLASEAANRACYNGGMSGAFAGSRAAVRGGNDRYGDLTQYFALQAPPDYLVILLGYNDWSQSPPVAGQGDFQAYYQDMLGRLSSLWPACKVLVLYPLEATTAGWNGTNRPLCNAAIAAAFAAVNNPNATLIDTTGWIVPASDCVDGIHPGAGGNVKIKNQLLNYIAPWAPAAAGGGASRYRCGLKGFG